MKGLVIAGTNSGCGKTTMTLALMASLAKRGLCISPFKVGPDFIDPGHHTRITGVTSRNLDGWMLSQDYNLRLFEKHS
ncbi:MAG: cobyrinate a,c-diamide synthase, partial [Deltaproteobacteria bacterium]|nr:cobyrinate a,c-diamide synthase [Deltaproteobacteria bacterium]